jgi:hypothetical protein
MHTGFDDFDLIRHGAKGRFDVFGQLLKIAGAGVVLPQKACRIQDLAHRSFNFALERLHAGGRNLAHDDAVVTVEHEPRQRIGFAEDEAPVALRAKPLAQRQSHSQPIDDERAVKPLRGIPADDARADERVRVDIRKPQKLLTVGMNVDRGACLEADERGCRIVDLIAENPQMARPDAPVFSPLEPQHGQWRRN